VEVQNQNANARWALVYIGNGATPYLKETTIAVIRVASGVPDLKRTISTRGLNSRASDWYSKTELRFVILATI
jgi:hypothetical protein